MNSVFNSDAGNANDYMKVEYLRNLQLARLQKIVRHAYNNVPLFRSQIGRAHV